MLPMPDSRCDSDQRWFLIEVVFPACDVGNFLRFVSNFLLNLIPFRLIRVVPLPVLIVIISLRILVCRFTSFEHLDMNFGEIARHYPARSELRYCNRKSAIKTEKYELDNAVWPCEGIKCALSKYTVK
jgi:hypothetical protein